MERIQNLEQEHVLHLDRISFQVCNFNIKYVVGWCSQWNKLHHLTPTDLT